MQRSTTVPPSAETRAETAAVTRRINRDRIRKLLLGTRDRNGMIKLIAIYGLLICIGFIYLYPILYMISASFMTLDDLLDSSIQWIPSSFNLDNYRQAGASMNYGNSLLQSFLIAGLPTLCNLVACSLTGYGLARYKFRGKGIIIGLIILTFVLPRQITMIPTYSMYANLGILNSVWAFIVPAIVAQGLNAPIFIMIFWQFFRNVPQALVEAAKIDGAGHFKSFFSISLPTAAPAFITVALFSFVWSWNEFYLTQLFVHGVLVESSLTTLIIQLQNFNTNYSSYAQTAASGATNLNESIKMAGTLIAVLPLMILYFVLQRHFVESIDRTGITGE